MREIFEAIKRAAIRINDALAYDDTGYAENQNATGDVQLKLDIKSDYIVEEELSRIKSIKTIASEEKDHAYEVNGAGEYLVGFDPLDGSSLVDTDLSVGSIFGIYRESFDGATIVGAAYVVYGPRIEMVIATDTVELYRLNKRGEFSYIQFISLNKKGKLNACGGTQASWYPHHKKMIDDLFNEGYRLRYSGGMVPDLHQILIKGGGLFSYPGTIDKPEGKLRMIFEVMPFAHVFEMAGGMAIDGFRNVLELTPRHIHDTTPCFFGSKKEIETVLKVYGEAKGS